MTGSYFARYWVSGGNEGYIDELYDDISCSAGCTIATGTPIGVALGADTPGIDFDLLVDPLIFMDGFGPGDTEAWTNEVP